MLRSRSSTTTLSSKPRTRGPQVPQSYIGPYVGLFCESLFLDIGLFSYIQVSFDMLRSRSSTTTLSSSCHSQGVAREGGCALVTQPPPLVEEEVEWQERVVARGRDNHPLLPLNLFLLPHNHPLLPLPALLICRSLFPDIGLFSYIQVSFDMLRSRSSTTTLSCHSLPCRNHCGPHRKDVCV